MRKTGYLFILVILSVTFSNCVSERPYANSTETLDATMGYERVIKPYYKKRVNTLGTVLNISFMGIGAAGGYLATAPGSTVDQATGKKTYGIAGEQADGSVQLYCAAGGLAVGYLVSRLFMLHSHKSRYITPKEYPGWVASYDLKKKKDYLFINQPNAYDDRYLTIVSRNIETHFKPISLYDLRMFSSLFPTSKYVDTAIITVTPQLATNELDTVIYEYADHPAVYTTKIEYVGRARTENEFYSALEKYKEAQANDSIQMKYSELILTYSFAKDFIGRYPGSMYFDDVYQRIYHTLSWNELGNVISMYPTVPEIKAVHAKAQYFEMASTFHDLHNVVTKYPEVTYVVKPYDNLNSEDSAKDVYDRLTGYKPLSHVNNISKVLSNIPEEFLVIQNKAINIEEIDTLYNYASMPWVQTDSATDIIDVIYSRYAKIKDKDLFIGKNLTEGYDTGKLYKRDGAALKGRLKDKTEIIGNGEKISSVGKKEIGTFENGVLNGQGKIILPSGTIEEGYFRDGSLEGGGKITHSTYVDSGIFRSNLLDNQGTRIYSNGNRYDGNFLQAKFSGHGTFTWNGGKKSFTGNFTDSKREGSGEIDFANGYKVYGTWKNDCPDGDMIIEKMTQNNTRSIEWSMTWNFRSCMIISKGNDKRDLPFTDAEILENLPVEQ